jgi:hypothetical protein
VSVLPPLSLPNLVNAVRVFSAVTSSLFLFGRVYVWRVPGTLPFVAAVCAEA